MNLSQNFRKKTLTREKNPKIFMIEKYVKGCFALSPLLVRDCLLFNALFSSSVKAPASQKKQGQPNTYCMPHARRLF